MPTQVFTFYSLKPGADVEKFKEWSRSVDQPACRAKDVCHRFDVYVVKGGNKQLDAPMIVEDVEVSTFEEWEAATSAPDHADVMKGWGEFADAASVFSVFCEKI